MLKIIETILIVRCISAGFKVNLHEDTCFPLVNTTSYLSYLRLEHASDWRLYLYVLQLKLVLSSVTKVRFSPIFGPFGPNAEPNLGERFGVPLNRIANFTFGSAFKRVWKSSALNFSITSAISVSGRCGLQKMSWCLTPSEPISRNPLVSTRIIDNLLGLAWNLFWIPGGWLSYVSIRPGVLSCWSGLGYYHKEPGDNACR